MALEFTTSYLADSLTLFRYYKALAERAMKQVSDEQLQFSHHAEANSIAVIVKHMAGNMRSRWRDFLTSDGEKPDRNRDTEFEEPPRTRQEVEHVWEDGWSYVFSALEPLSEDDLTRTVTIRGEAHSVMQAVNRQLTHYASHVGQIIFIAKMLRGQDWESLSIPRGKSDEYLGHVRKGKASQR